MAIYYMIRGINSLFYTIELIIIITVFVGAIIFYTKKIERKILFAFLIGGLINTGIELLLQGLGIRVVEGIFIFGIPINFPFICFILGFFDGGIKAIFGYLMVKIIFNREKFSGKALIVLFSSIFATIIAYSAFTAYQITLNPSIITFNSRELFGLLPTILLSLALGGSLLAVFSNKNLNREQKFTIFYFMIGQIVFMTAYLVPLHVFLIRYIGVQSGITFIPADLGTQILLMYGYFLIFEGIGVNIINFPIFLQAKIFEFDN